MEERVKVITAFGNQLLQDHLLKKMPDVEFICEDLQYQEALLDTLKKDCPVNVLILNMSLDGLYDTRTLIQSIRNIKKGINIVPLFKSTPEEDIQKWLESCGIHFVLIDNSFTIEDIYHSLKPEKKLQIMEAQKSNFENTLPQKKGVLARFFSSIMESRNHTSQSAPEIHRMKNTVTIALFSSHSGTGCTHTTISLAWFLSAHKNSQVAVVELNESGAFKRLGRNAKHISEKGYEFNGMHLYYATPISSLIKLKTYSYILIDCGCICLRNETGEIRHITNTGKSTLISDRLSEIERADMKLCVCQIKPWQMDETLFMMDSELGHENTGDCLFYFTMTDTHTFMDVRKKFSGKKLYKAAYDPEIFGENLERDQIFQKMLNGLLPNGYELHSLQPSKV